MNVLERLEGVRYEDLRERYPMKGFFRIFENKEPTFSTREAVTEDLLPLCQSKMLSIDPEELMDKLEYCESEATEKCTNVIGGLTHSYITMLYMCTSQFFEASSFFEVLNQALREENREAIKPLKRIIWILMWALNYCPVYEGRFVYRGLKLNIADKYELGKQIRWHQFSSCSYGINIQERYTDCQGDRTLFNIELTTNRARMICKYSFFSEEKEVLLPANSCFRVIGNISMGGGLRLVQLQEIEPDDPILVFHDNNSNALTVAAHAHALPSPPPLAVVSIVDNQLNQLCIEEVQLLLDALRLPNLKAKFLEHNIDGTVLALITTIDELAELDIKRVFLTPFFAWLQQAQRSIAPVEVINRIRSVYQRIVLARLEAEEKVRSDRERLETDNKSKKTAVVSSYRSSAFVLSYSPICELICTYFEPKDLLKLSTVSKFWGSCCEFGWNHLSNNLLLKSLTFKRNICRKRNQILTEAWPSSPCNKRILCIGGSFGTSAEVSASTVILSEALQDASYLRRYQMVFPDVVGAVASCSDACGNIRLLGGWRDHDELSMSNNIIVKNIVESYSTMASEFILPVNRCYAAAASSIEGSIFYLGGGGSPYRGANVSNQTYFSKVDERAVDLHSYDPYSSWQRGPDMRTNRCGHSAVTLFDNSIVALGGYHSGLIYLDSSERFDPIDQRWLPLPSMSAGKSGAYAELGLYGEVYVFGGSIDGTNSLSLCERLDLRERKWQSLRPMNKQRGYFSGCLTRGGQICVLGGLHASRFVKSLEMYDIRTGIWILSEPETNSELSRLFSRSAHSMVYC